MNYTNYTVCIMKGDTVKVEIHNVFALNKQHAIHDAWERSAAKPYADGKHEAKVYS